MTLPFLWCLHEFTPILLRQHYVRSYKYDGVIVSENLGYEKLEFSRIEILKISIFFNSIFFVFYSLKLTLICSNLFVKVEIDCLKKNP